MCARRRNTRRGRPRQPAPQTLPEDLYDYDDDPAPRISSPRASPPDAFDVEKLPVIDDWPEKVPSSLDQLAHRGMQVRREAFWIEAKIDATSTDQTNAD